MSDIRDIPGIGDKTARRLLEHFESYEEVMKAFAQRNVTAIAAVPGIGEKNAIALVQAYIFKDENISPDDFLRTREAHRVYRRLLDIIKSYTSTAYARDKLNIYFPMPSSKKDTINSMMKDVAAARRMVENISTSSGGSDILKEVLADISPVRTAGINKVRDRVIVAAKHEEYQQVQARFGHAINVLLAESPRELADAATAYHYVTASMAMEGVNIPYDAQVEYADLAGLEMWEVVPEIEIAFFSLNLKSITSAIQAYQLTGNAGSHVFVDIKPDHVGRLGSALEVVGENNDIKTGTDREMDRIRSSLEGLDDQVKTEEKNADAQLREFLENSTVTLSGKDLMDAMGGDVKGLLDREISGQYTRIVKEAVQGIAGGLDLDPKESLVLDDLFSQDNMTSIEANRDVVEQLRSLLRTRLAKRRMDLLRGAARTLSDLKDTARALVSGAMELDMWFAIGLFARECNLTEPSLVHEPCINIRAGTNLFFPGDFQPVDYALGSVRPGSTVREYTPERVAVLSGVNSGGKTTTLDLVAQVLILSHMGFPVPGREVTVGLTDELYYFGKSGGTMDAGAFESTLREFSVVWSTGKMAVLVDELESITEPGASARIIGGILESLAENPNSVGIFVSHLAESIMEHTSAPVRVDGIEAKGLDDDLNLIVDRNPRYNYTARSTPELIVERLVRRAGDEKRDFYQRLLDKFK
ncbi:MAG: helix-hairpin-helix domain-containing protein [ANME-2 cluster archaeon]|nr:helix-hairpin-helix domain-containing protein [ANME-2 cluster archaeon]